MRIGLHLIPNDWATLRERASYADRAGFSHLWIAESHLTVYDVFAAMQEAAACTSRIVIGPGCTNVALRHDSVVAATLASLNELAGGRVVCGLGSGDTPVVMVGRRPSRLAELREAVEHIRTLTDGGAVRYGEHEVRLAWCKQRLPVYVIAEGPRMLELAAEVGDGVLSGNGISEAVVGWVGERVHAGAARGRRAADDLDVWYSCMVAVEASREAARAAIRTRVANRARHNFLAAPELVPPERRGEVEALINGFDLARWNDPKHARFVTEFMLDRFTIAGTADEVIEALRRLEAHGVRSLMIDLPSDRFDATLRVLGEQVLPRL